MDNSHVTWRKSTYSGGNGGNLRRSRHMAQSTHSGGNGGAASR